NGSGAVTTTRSLTCVPLAARDDRSLSGGMPGSGGGAGGAVALAGSGLAAGLAAAGRAAPFPLTWRVVPLTDGLAGLAGGFVALAAGLAVSFAAALTAGRGAGLVAFAARERAFTSASLVMLSQP